MASTSYTSIRAPLNYQFLGVYMLLDGAYKFAILWVLVWRMIGGKYTLTHLLTRLCYSCSLHGTCGRVVSMSQSLCLRAAERDLNLKLLVCIIVYRMRKAFGQWSKDRTKHDFSSIVRWLVDFVTTLTLALAVCALRLLRCLDRRPMQKGHTYDVTGRFAEWLSSIYYFGADPSSYQFYLDLNLNQLGLDERVNAWHSARYKFWVQLAREKDYL